MIQAKLLGYRHCWKLLLLTHICHHNSFIPRISGIGQYDKIGLISNNRWEWAALAAASYSLNATIVPMVSLFSACEPIVN